MVVDEYQVKMGRLREFLDRHLLNGVVLTQRCNFSWITGGRTNYIANNATAGVASIYATRDKLICLANTIEAPRFVGEELIGTGIEVVSFDWWDGQAAKRAAQDVLAGDRVATDGETFGLDLLPLPADFAELRWSLTQDELSRFAEGGRLASLAMEAACFDIKPGQSELEIAGVLNHHVFTQGLVPVVTLIAADERVSAFRHPIPTRHLLRRYIMLVTCAEFGGLISNLTRFVPFEPLTAEVKQKQQAVVNIDLAVNAATVPGRTLGDVFADLAAAYDREGFAGQWKLHHQGGSAGYNNREVVAVPRSPVRVRENQAFAWNPSITGVKSEDTIVATVNGFEVLTPMSTRWPKLRAIGAPGTLEMDRPDILLP